MSLSASLLALSLLAPAGGEIPEIRAVVVSGVSQDERETLLTYLRVAPGRRLTGTTDALATRLASHYRIRGFPAAEGKARFEPDNGTLFLDVDQGRLASIAIDGLEPDEQEPVLRALDLRPGAPFTDDAVTEALFRAHDAFPGALETVGEPPYSWERSDRGIGLTLHLRRKTAYVEWGRGGTGRAPLYNRVDGFAPGARARIFLFAPSLEPVEGYAHVSYGLAAEKARFALGVRRSLGQRTRLTLGYEFHDLTDTDDSFRAIGLEKPKGRKVFFSIFENYYARRGHEVSALLRASRRVQLGLNWRSDRYTSLPIEADGSLFFDKDAPASPPVAEGSMRSLMATARWSPSALFADADVENDALLVRNPYGTAFVRAQGFRAEASFEWADPSLGGKLFFHRLIVHLRGSRHLALRHSLTGRALFGAGKDLPPQRLFVLGGMGTLRGRPLGARTGERMAMATAEYVFDLGSPFPGLAVFYDGGDAWNEGVARRWLSDVGVGLTWPGGETPLARIDLAVPLNTEGAARRVRVTGSLLIPLL